jgi:hypothetical protein
MPNYALGDVLTSFTYLNATMDGLTESVGTNYGTALLRKPWLSPIANFELNEAFPDLMHHELLRGYCSGVTFMDEQLGKVNAATFGVLFIIYIHELLLGC